MIALPLRLLAAALFVALLLALEWAGGRARRPLTEQALTLAAVLATAGLAFFLVVSWRQLNFPLQLEAMELTILQHAERLAAGLAVYPPPSADFVALAYNPGLYLVTAPALKLWPGSLLLIRLPDFLASVVLILLFGYLLHCLTRSWRWALVGALLPVLATRSFDCNLVTGHADILVIAIALVGALLMQGRRMPLSISDRELMAAVLLVSAFWFKQNAAIMAVGTAALFIRRDWRSAWRPVGTLVMFGPVAYGLAGPPFFGPDFLEATWRVPASWTRWDYHLVIRYLGFVLNWWAVPCAVAVWAWLRAARQRRLLREPLIFLFPFALLSGVAGALDAGSSDNVFSLAGAWMLVMLLQEVGPALASAAAPRARRLAICALGCTAVLLLHDFRDWDPPHGAPAAFADLESTLLTLDGPVYAPWLGNLPVARSTTARAHWVALEDRVRGSGPPGPRDPWVMRVLAPVATASAPAYLLTSSPLDSDYLLGWLGDTYALERDYESRWAALRELPHRFGMRYPRYLYRRTSS